MPRLLILPTRPPRVRSWPVYGLNDDLNLVLETVLRSVYHAVAGRGMLGHGDRHLIASVIG